MNQEDLEKKIKSLESRNRKLARLKSHYQMESEIIAAMAAAAGLEELVKIAAEAIMNALGGSNVQIYYEKEAEWYYADLTTDPVVIDRIDNEDVLKAIYTGEVSNYKDRGNEEMAKLLNYVHPLVINDQVIGVVVLEGVLGFFEQNLTEEISNIISFFTLALKNEINSANLMLHAYETLTKKSKELEKQIEEKTKEQIKFRNTINASFDGFWIVNENSEFLYINDAYCDLTGYSREELIGRSIAYIEAVDSEEVIKKRTQIVIEEGQDRFETRHRCKDGSLVEVEVNINKSVEDDDLYVFIRDLTERKRLEEQRNQVSKMESIGRLAGGVAHDLNNMLTPILAYGDLLAQNQTDEKNRKRAEMILKAGISAREIIQQLLAFSRKQDLSYKVRDLNTIIQNFSILLYRTLREDMTFTLNLCSEELPVYADSSQIEQVIMNLVVNARDSIEGPEGKILISSSLVVPGDLSDADLKYMPPGPYAKISVRDNGCGMDPLILKDIFEPFFTTKGEMGTGLGLATVYGIIEQHKGRIIVESNPGKGTEFIIFLPIIKEEITAQPEREPLPEVLIKDCRILIIEDSEDIRNTVGDMLKQKGIGIFIASDADHAIEVMKLHGEINLILSDIVMPGMNGTELYEKLRMIKDDLRVIFMSGYSNEILNEYKIDEKSGSFIQKPFTAEQLLMKIGELFGTDPIEIY
ncbi:PAS domain S-box protein [Spirochaeta isovalerica]|uniref:histidine kinase n=1 Tax=Spirochaeta isovalerica TaxID=150 RepID=A0A841RBX6_9SPIO|nr:PAS domain S-box-containing protein [Spirochaeta isovalerica]